MHMPAHTEAPISDDELMEDLDIIDDEDDIAIEDDCVEGPVDFNEGDKTSTFEDFADEINRDKKQSRKWPMIIGTIVALIVVGAIVFWAVSATTPKMLSYTGDAAHAVDDVAELETGKQSAAPPAEAQKMIEEKENNGHEDVGTEEAEQAEKVIEIDFPMVTSLANRIRMNNRNVIVNIINEQLMAGGMSTILHRPVLTEEISGEDVSLGNITFWRLSRTELLADVEVSVCFTIADKDHDYTASVGMYVTLWYDSDEGFFGELYEMGSIENRPDRSYWKLDPFMVPFLSKDSVEQAGEEQWQEKHSEAMKDAGERKARILAEAYGLRITSMRLAGCPSQDHVLFFDAGTVLVQDPPARGVRQLPPPRPVEVGEKTIVINSAAKARMERDFIIYKACFEYEWYYLFYKLNGCVNTDARQFRYYRRKLKVKKEGIDAAEFARYKRVAVSDFVKSFDSTSITSTRLP